MPSTTISRRSNSRQSADLLCRSRMVGQDDRSRILAARGRKTGPSLEVALKHRYRGHTEVAGCETCHGDRRQLIFRHIDKVRCRRAARRQLPQTNVEGTCARGLGIGGGGGEPVEDDGDDGNSPFARTFLKALSNNTDVIDGTRLFAEMAPRHPARKTNARIFRCPRFGARRRRFSIRAQAITHKKSA